MGSKVPRLLTLNLKEKYMKQQYLSSKSINIMFATPLDNSQFLLSTGCLHLNLLMIQLFSFSTDSYFIQTFLPITNHSCLLEIITTFM